MPVPHRLLALTAAASVGAFGVAAVAVAQDDGGASGASGATATAARTTSLRVSASKTKLRFNTKRLNAKRGKVTIVMANPSGLPHGIAVEGHGVDKDGKIVTKGKTSRVTVTLKRGTYTFYCPFDGHRKAGMQGKLVVR